MCFAVYAALRAVSAKKVLISNYCAAAVAALDALTGAPALTTVWARALLFTLQIYFDFSGYSDMAIGLGRMLGFDFPENFNYPFVSASATEFWRRWHISLSSWFRDYLFYPVLRSRAMNSLSRSLRAHGHKKAARAAITVTALLCVWSAPVCGTAQAGTMSYGDFTTLFC